VPWKSKSQQRWGTSPSGHAALGDAGVKEWNQATSNYGGLPEKKPMAGGWMQDESDREAKAGTKGAFSGAAAKAGKTTAQYADEKQDAPGKVGKRARMAKMFMSAKKG
jgi:hypothetical protein